MKNSLRYATHLPVLMRAIEKTGGDVLELGIGIFSSPYLHWVCAMRKRRLVSLDNDEYWVHWVKGYGYATAQHTVALVENWDEANIERPWDVVLVDHSPSERRVVEIRRLAQLAKYLIVHDSNGRYDWSYHYSEVWPLFKYQCNFDEVDPSTTVLSNFVDLGDFWTL